MGSASEAGGFIGSGQTLTTELDSRALTIMDIVSHNKKFGAFKRK